MKSGHAVYTDFSLTIEKKLTNSSNVQGKAAFEAAGMVLGGYKPGFELVRGSHPNAIEHFVVLSERGSPRLLLPRARPIMQTAVTTFLGGYRFAFLMPPLLQIASRAGNTFSYLTTTVSLISQERSPSPLRELIADVLQRSDFQIALRLSFGRPNAKTVAMAISDSGEALCFAKLGSEEMTNRLVAHESSVLEDFEGAADMSVVVPRRLYSGVLAAGHNILITDPLELEPLNRDARSAHQAADAFASQNLVTNSTLSDSSYWRHTVERVEKFGVSGNSDEILRSTIAEIERTWGGHSFDICASHGDWTRANLGMVNGRVAALDWERCTKLAPRGIDIAHFALSENSSGFLRKTLDTDRVANTVRQYLTVANRPPNEAEPLIVLALLEMVIRFRSAQSAGVKTSDSKFGPALQAALQQWSV